MSDSKSLKEDVFPEGNLTRKQVYILCNGERMINRIESSNYRDLLIKSYSIFSKKKYIPIPGESFIDVLKHMDDVYELYDSLDNDVDKPIITQVDPEYKYYRVILAPERKYICGWRRIRDNS